jgi:CRP-like cAMP-binding protein
MLGHLEEMGTVSRVLSLRKGEAIYHQGELSAAIFFLLSGMVELAVQAPDGREIGLAVLTAGAIFGELALTKADRMVTARAVTDVTVALVSADEVKSRALDDPNLLDEIFDLMSERLQITADAVTQLLSEPLTARLAKWLLQLAAEDPIAHSRELEMTQEELAALVGGTREAVNRELRRFAARGWLSLGRRRIVVLRADELEAYAERGGYRIHRPRRAAPAGSETVAGREVPNSA